MFVNTFVPARKHAPSPGTLWSGAPVLGFSSSPSCIESSSSSGSVGVEGVDGSGSGTIISIPSSSSSSGIEHAGFVLHDIVHESLLHEHIKHDE